VRGAHIVECQGHGRRRRGLGVGRVEPRAGDLPGLHF
jgi:hypothetical protein